MALWRDLSRSGSGEGHSRIAGGALSALAHLVLLLALLLTVNRTVPVLVAPPPITMALLPAPPKPPPAPPAFRPKLLAPKAAEAAMPAFTVAADAPAPALPPSPVDGPAAAPDPAPGAAVESDLAPYLAKISAYMQLRLHKPFFAVRTGETGTAWVHLVVNRSGHVLLVELLKSSGHRDLDAEAIAVVNRSDPLPPIPPEIKADVVNGKMPVNFGK